MYNQVILEKKNVELTIKTNYTKNPLETNKTSSPVCDQTLTPVTSSKHTIQRDMTQLNKYLSKNLDNDASFNTLISLSSDNADEYPTQSTTSGHSHIEDINPNSNNNNCTRPRKLQFSARHEKKNRRECISLVNGRKSACFRQLNNCTDNNKPSKKVTRNYVAAIAKQNPEFPLVSNAIRKPTPPPPTPATMGESEVYTNNGVPANLDYYSRGYFPVVAMVNMQRERTSELSRMAQPQPLPNNSEPYRNIGVKPARPARFIPKHPVYKQHPGSTIYEDEHGHTVIRTSFTIDAEKRLLEEQAEQDRLDEIEETKRPYIDKLASMYSGTPFIGLSGRLYGAKHIKFSPIPPEKLWAKHSKSEHDRKYETKLRPAPVAVRPPPEIHNIRSPVPWRFNNNPWTTEPILSRKQNKEKKHQHKLRKIYSMLREIRQQYGYDAIYSPVTPNDRINVMVLRKNPDCPSRQLAEEAISYCEKDGVEFPMECIKPLQVIKD